jgi:hypothetical protein
LELLGLKEEERQMIFWKSVHEKRMLLAVMDAVPSAVAWTLTTVLLVNVSA